ncbi:MAG TPA: sensor histidine kinase, partial [Kiloniellaceae bacterium]
QALLRLRARSENRYSNLMALRLDGAVACATGLEQPSTFANSDWFIRTLANDDFTVTGKVELPGVDQQRLLASLPLRAEGGKIVGIVAMALRRTWLMDVLLSDDGQPLANTSAALLDQRGSVMAESAVGAAAGEWLPATFVIGARLSGDAQIFQTEGRDGIERIFALAPLYEQQVYIVLGGVVGHLLADPSLQLIAGLAYPVLMWAIAIIVAWFAVDNLVLRQVLRLRKTASAYARGHFEVRTAGIDEAPQEIRELGMTMHKMADVISLHESELRKSLEEQKTLLREVYHRVKNNLQVVSSLVNLQVSRATNEHERTALRITQDRIHALSMVHSNLYDSPELHRIVLQEFVPQLCEYLRQAQGTLGENLRIEYDIDPVLSEPDRAVPLALLITEVVTSALKHSRPGGGGKLCISLKRDADDRIAMTISGDGDFTASVSPESLGWRLVQAFAKQLGGEVNIENDGAIRLTQGRAPETDVRRADPVPAEQDSRL